MIYSYDLPCDSVSDNSIHYFFSSNGSSADTETLQLISDKIDTLNDTISYGSFILIFSIGILIGFFTLKFIFGRA